MHKLTSFLHNTERFCRNSPALCRDSQILSNTTHKLEFKKSWCQSERPGLYWMYNVSPAFLRMQICAVNFAAGSPLSEMLRSKQCAHFAQSIILFKMVDDTDLTAARDCILKKIAQIVLSRRLSPRIARELSPLTSVVCPTTTVPRNCANFSSALPLNSFVPAETLPLFLDRSQRDCTQSFRVRAYDVTTDVMCYKFCFVLLRVIFLLEVFTMCDCWL